MSLVSPHLQRHQIRLTFELHRLSQENLEKAYETVVPIYVRVISRQEKQSLNHTAPITALPRQERRIA